MSESVIHHEFKSAPSVFYPAKRGTKMFEFRKDDRGGYHVGQNIRLRCYEEGIGYTNEAPLDRTITYILYPGQFGLQDGYCILRLAPILAALASAAGAGAWDWVTEAQIEKAAQILWDDKARLSTFRLCSYAEAVQRDAEDGANRAEPCRQLAKAILLSAVPASPRSEKGEGDAARVCHDEQMTVWTGEIAGNLSMGGYLREDFDYEDRLALDAAIGRDLRSIIESAFTHPELAAGEPEKAGDARADTAMRTIWAEWCGFYNRHFRGVSGISLADQMAFYEIAQPIMRDLAYPPAPAQSPSTSGAEG